MSATARKPQTIKSRTQGRDRSVIQTCRGKLEGQRKLRVRICLLLIRWHDGCKMISRASNEGLLDVYILEGISRGWEEAQQHGTFIGRGHALLSLF
jgi:hypothetical protein